MSEEPEAPVAEDESQDAGQPEGSDDAPTEAYWPEDWRDNMAADDDKLLKRLGRFGTPNDMLTSYQALEQKLNSKEGRGELPEKYTDAELVTYREANGIPSEADGYFTDMPEGLVIGDEDKELFGSFAQTMHDKNEDPATVHSAVEWYYGMVEEQQAKQAETDELNKQSAEDVLRVEWGGEYRANINTLTGYLENAPEEVSDALMSARSSDGLAIMNNPDVVRFLAQKAREENPFVTITPQGGDATSLEDEMNEIKALMGNRESAYWKGPGSDKMQARYRQLLEYQTKNAA